MTVNLIAENVFATLGTVCWCVQMVPQAWMAWREKSTFGLSPWLMLIWASASLPLGVYNIAQNVNIPLILQPQLFGTLAAICWIQCLHYQYRLSVYHSILTLAGLLLGLGALQVGLVYAVRHGLAENNTRPLEFFGVLTAMLVFLGLLPQFFEIYKLGEVSGVSTLFMVIDGLGGLFSALSLAFKETIDPLLAFSYISVIVLDALVIALKLILNPLAARRRAREAASSAPNGHPIGGPSQHGIEDESNAWRGPYTQPRRPSIGQETEHGIPLAQMTVLRSRSGEGKEAGKESSISAQIVT
ncbi:hypothetical protein DACRYDRAFT_21172 [Dacryopinax primogenitus]|uniref:PQ-loop-domain-containing protein n=1 Tax=Dacryopinax primogenitus (strain DJM 731) TaxID=1858805 RepID=M5G616_DACPD|nr:uncharacterized protein DACRYDRAFT_21172 [Dacryopinax primogenitus]EJU03660.1 hypothetical protein DACRYDRAFT_21172 [Dacryopinax primogenitus]